MQAFGAGQVVPSGGDTLYRNSGGIGAPGIMGMCRQVDGAIPALRLVTGVPTIAALSLPARNGIVPGDRRRRKLSCDGPMQLIARNAGVLACAAVLSIATLTPAADGDTGPALVDGGNADYRRGDLDAARAAYSGALAIDAADVAARNNRALVRARQGDLGAALDDLGIALEASPGNGVIWNNRANVNCEMARTDAAVADRVQALYRGRFTAAAAQAGMRRSGHYDGPADGIWGPDSADALYDWTAAGCPGAPKSLLIGP